MGHVAASTGTSSNTICCISLSFFHVADVTGHDYIAKSSRAPMSYVFKVMPLGPISLRSQLS